MEVVKIYHWSFPAELRDPFKKDWEHITREVAKPLGQTVATLFQLENDDFISVTVWPDEVSYQNWVAWIMKSTESAKYYPYEQERRDAVVCVL